MNANDVPRKGALYLLLLALLGSDPFVWQTLPEFRQVAIDRGTQLPRDSWSDLISFGVLCNTQLSFWCRIIFVPISFRRPDAVLDRLFLFLGSSVSSSAARCSASPSSGTCPNLIATSTFS